MNLLSPLDIRAATRRLAANRPLLFGSLVSLGLGMGGAIVAYGTIDGLILHPFPSVRQPERVVRLTVRDALPPANQIGFSQLSYPFLVELRRRASNLDDVAGVFERNLDDPLSLGRSVRVAVVTSRYFDVFQSRLSAGRVFAEEADPSSPAPVAVVSAAYARRAHGGLAAALGSHLHVGRSSFTVIGIMAPAFRGDAAAPIDIWLPLGAAPEQLPEHWRSDNTSYWLRIVARLRSGATLAAAQAQATAVVRGTQPGPSREGSATVDLSPLTLARGPDGNPLPEARLSVWFGLLACLVLGMSAFNVTALLLASTIERRGEAAVRRALGANRWQLVRPVVLEALGLAICGGLAAIILSIVVNHWIGLSMPEVALARTSGANARLLGFATGLIAATALVVAAAPVVAVGEQDTGRLLRVHGRGRGVNSSRMRITMLAAQVGFAIVLVGIAQAFARSFAEIRSLNLGFDPRHVVAVQLDLGARNIVPGIADEMFASFAPQAAQIPGVTAVSIATSVPFVSASGLAVFAEGDPYPLDDSGVETYFNAVTPDFISALGTSLLRGRGFTEADREGSERVAIVSSNLTDHAWPSQDPLGRCLHLGADSAPCTRIVGVLQVGRLMRLREDPRAFVYIPLGQNTFFAPRRALIVHASGDPEPVARELRRLLAKRAGPLAEAQVVALRDVVVPQWRQWSVGAVVASILAILGTCLAAFGVYAAVSMQVGSRTLELAIRGAMGAGPADLVVTCSGSILIAAAVGAALGLMALLALSRPIAPLLFQATTADVAGLMVPLCVLLAVTLMAAGVPSLRVARSALFENLRGT